MADELACYPLTHAHVRPVTHPELHVPVTARSTVRYLRFLRPVTVDYLTLARSVYGRWEPNVPTHAAHLVVSRLDEARGRWEVVRELELPPDPRISGEGLSEQMTIAQMNQHFARVLQEPPLRIDLGGVQTDVLRVECDREHPVWPNHGECNGGAFNVPFGILDPLRAYGTAPTTPVPKPERLPLLQRGAFRPEAPRGMRVRNLPDMLLFGSRRFSIGFSLRRPLLMHLGWDALDSGRSGNNRLACGSRGRMVPNGLAGPWLRTTTADYSPRLWTGDVTVAGTSVSYTNLHCGHPGLTLNVIFTVQSYGLTMAIYQTCAQPVPALEAEGWRLPWDLARGITGAAAEPTLAPGRCGEVKPPFYWASDGVGCLVCYRPQEASSPAWVQVESYRAENLVVGGLVLAPRPAPDQCLVLPAGVTNSGFGFLTANLEPDKPAATARPGPGVRRHWATVFSCFRPEHRGFSNHSASVNCHLSQLAPLEVVAHTRRRPEIADPVALGRFTIGQALLDGGGYGYWRNLYLDSDPCLVSAAGRLHQAAPDLGWLRQIEPGLRPAVGRMIATLGDEHLVVCRDLSGNSGSYRWSSNGMDVVGFGHLDAYVNALTYRALRNAAALFADLGDGALAGRCRELAAALRAQYASALLNPETGWVAGWRSRDGQLHDFAFTWVNGVAAAFGLLEPEVAQKALRGLEQLREKVGCGDARLGIPLNLLPTAETDHVLPRILGEPQPTFELYTDGSLSPHGGLYYLRALSIYGLQEAATRLAADLDAGYAAGVFNGPTGAGHEFRSWEGVPCGYEGTLIGCFAPVYAIAIAQGVFPPRDPEWWPPGG